MNPVNLFTGLIMDATTAKVVCGFCGSSTPGGLLHAPNCCKQRELLLRDELVKPKFTFRMQGDGDGRLELSIGREIIDVRNFERALVPGSFLGLFGRRETWEEAVAREKQSMLNRYYEKVRLERDLSDA